MSDSDHLPSGWTRVSVAAIGAHGDQAVLTGPFGSKLKSGDFMSFGTPVLTIGCLTESGLDLRKANFISDGHACEFDRYRLRPGDLLFSRMASVGRVCKVPPEHDRSLFNYHLMRLRLCEEVYLPDLFVQFIRGSRTVVAHLEEVNHGATRDGINTGQLLSMPVEVPPIPEQHRILAKIEALQARASAAKEALDAIPPLLEKFRQSVLAAAFRGDLTREWREAHPDVEPAAKLLERIRAERRAAGKVTGTASRSSVADETACRVPCGDLPGSWQLVRLRDVSRLQAGYAFQSGWYSATGVRLLRGTNIVPGGTRWDDAVCLPAQHRGEFADYELSEGDLVIAMDRPLISTGIKVARLKVDDIPSLLLQRVGRFQLSSGVDAAFAHLFLEGPLFRQQVAGQATGTQLPHISGNDIEAAPFPLPPLAEQHAIAAVARRMLDMAATIGVQVVGGHLKLATLTQSILSKAFRGELVPQDPNDEPASELLERIRRERDGQGAPPAKRGRGRPKSTPTET